MARRGAHRRSAAPWPTFDDDTTVMRTPVVPTTPRAKAVANNRPKGGHATWESDPKPTTSALQGGVPWLTAQPSSRLHRQREPSSGKARVKRIPFPIVFPPLHHLFAAPVVDATRLHRRTSIRTMVSATDKDRTRALLATPLRGDRNAQSKGSASRRRNQPSYTNESNPRQTSRCRAPRREICTRARE